MSFGSKVTVPDGPSNSPRTLETTMCRTENWLAECPGSIVHVAVCAPPADGTRERDHDQNERRAFVCASKRSASTVPLQICSNAGKGAQYTGIRLRKA